MGADCVLPRDKWTLLEKLAIKRTGTGGGNGQEMKAVGARMGDHGRKKVPWGRAGEQGAENKEMSPNETQILQGYGQCPGPARHAGNQPWDRKTLVHWRQSEDAARGSWVHFIHLMVPGTRRLWRLLSAIS